MNTVHALFIYTAIVTCVIARERPHGPDGHSNHGYHHVSASHIHYAYHPPRHIHFTCRYCLAPEAYPVYRHQPPLYVFVYKEYGSRFSDLFAGLALYNLGKSVEVGHHPNLHYYARPHERCSLQVIERSHFEQSEIPCFMLSSFRISSPSNKSHMMDITSPNINVRRYLFTGKPLEVTKAQECVLWYNHTEKVRNHVPCALLKEYAKTLKPIGIPVYVWLPTLIAAIAMFYMCCHCFSKNNKDLDLKETIPLHNVPYAPHIVRER